MNDELHKRIEVAARHPKNMGEMSDADAVGTGGSPGCGDMLRMWLKYKVEKGQKIIDKASFQSFGCETAIAAASLATELIRGKTPEQAANLSGTELAEGLGALPPTKVHCTQLVEDALRSALFSSPKKSEPAHASLIDSLTKDDQKSGKLVFLDDDPHLKKP